MGNKPNDQVYLTVKEAALLVGKQETTIRGLLAQKKLEGHKNQVKGSGVLISKEELLKCYPASPGENLREVIVHQLNVKDAQIEYLQNIHDVQRHYEKAMESLTIQLKMKDDLIVSQQKSIQFLEEKLNESNSKIGPFRLLPKESYQKTTKK